MKAVNQVTMWAAVHVVGCVPPPHTQREREREREGGARFPVRVQPASDSGVCGVDPISSDSTSVEDGVDSYSPPPKFPVSGFPYPADY